MEKDGKARPKLPHIVVSSVPKVLRNKMFMSPHESRWLPAALALSKSQIHHESIQNMVSSLFPMEKVNPRQMLCMFDVLEDL
jgi:hypothetical protein